MNRGFRALSSVRIAALPPDGQAAVTIQPRGANVKLVGISEAVETGTGSRRTAFASVYSGGKPSRKLRKMSAKSRAKIATAQRRRWAKFRKSKA